MPDRAGLLYTGRLKQPAVEGMVLLNQKVSDKSNRKDYTETRIIIAFPGHLSGRR